MAERSRRESPEIACLKPFSSYLDPCDVSRAVALSKHAESPVIGVPVVQPEHKQEQEQGSPAPDHQIHPGFPRDGSGAYSWNSPKHDYDEDCTEVLGASLAVETLQLVLILAEPVAHVDLAQVHVDLHQVLHEVRPAVPLRSKGAHAWVVCKTCMACEACMGLHGVCMVGLHAPFMYLAYNADLIYLPLVHQGSDLRCVSLQRQLRVPHASAPLGHRPVPCSASCA
jgi:hypothetical protein